MFLNGHADIEKAVNDGGAVLVHRGTLDATAVSFLDNVASDAGGALAIAPEGTVRLRRSAFFSNRANVGGAVYNGGGTLIAANTTISYNRTTRDGGGIASDGSTSSTVLVNMTIAKNSADATPASGGSGGGVAMLGGSLTVTNSIIATNEDLTPAGGDIFADVFGAFTDDGHNIIGVADGSTGFTVSTLVGTAASPRDPKLGDLATHDGDRGSHKPLPDSPAVNAGDPAACAASPVDGVDQRGKPRPAQHCDIGTFELDSTMTLTLDVSPNTAEPGALVTLTCHASLLPIGPNPTGPIEFLEGATRIATAMMDPNGDAIATTSTLSPGAHEIVCSYPGDTSLPAATSPPVVVVVNEPPGPDATPAPTPASRTEPEASPDGGGGCRAAASTNARPGAFAAVAILLFAFRRRARGHVAR